MNSFWKNINTSRFVVTFLLANILCSGVFAEEVKNLYTASVEVGSQSEEDKRFGFRDALHKVLIKVSGQVNISERIVGIDRLEPERYVLSFSYIENPLYGDYQSLRNRLDTIKVALESHYENKEESKLGADLHSVNEYIRLNNINDEVELKDQIKVFLYEAEGLIENHINTSSNENNLSNENTLFSENKGFNNKLIEDTHLQKLSKTASHFSLTVEQEMPKPFLLKVQLARSEINNLLRGNSVSVWGSARPSIVIWPLIEKHAKRTLIGADQYDQLFPGVKKVAEEIGLPAAYVVAGDLEDQFAADLSLLWGMFADGLPKEFSKYDQDVEIILTLKPSADQSGTFTPAELGSVALNGEPNTTEMYDLRWKAVINTKDAREIGPEYSINSVTANKLSKAVLSSVTGYLASVYAVDGEQSSEEIFEIEVSGITDFMAFSKVQEALISLDPVSQLSLKRFQGDKAHFNARLLSSVENFSKHIELTGSLSKFQDDYQPLILETGSVLRYTWLGNP